MTWRRYKLNLRNSLLSEEYFLVMEQFDSTLSSVIDSTLGLRCRSFGYRYSEIIRSLMSIYFCGGSCVEDVTMLLNCMFAYGQLKEGEMYDVDFDHQFIETEKYDAKPTYKKFLGYRPGVAVIGDLIVGIENSDGNTNVRFHQKDTQKRFFERFEQNGVTVNRFRADCGSCSEEIVEEIEKRFKSFYIRANRCSSDSMQQVA